jgi:RNase P subunit RPR2
MTTCNKCYSSNVEETNEIMQIEHNNRPIAVIVPTLTCWDCGHKWTDSRASDILYRAILEAS